MATTTASENQWLRPLKPVLIGLVVGIILILIGNAYTKAEIDIARVIPFLIVGAALVYVTIALVGSPKLWAVGTREVVFMAIGAALYGVLSWLTNSIFQLPSISLVTLRPAIAIPIFFGVLFGPAVGFFVGFVGNILGDALSGWGISPTWDIGNGLIGLVAGLSLAFRSRKASLNVLTAIIIVVNLLLTVLLLTNPNIEDQMGGGTVGTLWWVPLVVVVLAAGVRFLLRGKEEIGAAALWGAVAIIIGIGFAAIADIWWNGYSLLTALLGEFVPGAGSNLVNALILVPLLLVAYQAARAQSGR
ncbi:hypothetical protein F8S13_24385 [Chloroflexia bacterium SDU3-3]|nr:hypothetical protein F8S13_24385 [Chloroflexia bacterium SDU3-3]